MGDIIYPGILLTRLQKTVTEMDVMEMLYRQLKDTVAINETPEVCLHKKPPSVVKAVIRGIQLPYKEIRRILCGSICDGKTTHIEGPDFGNFRGCDGRMTFQKMKLHEKLVGGQMGVTPIDVFSCDFETSIGGLDNLHFSILLENERGLPLDVLNLVGECLFTTSTTRGLVYTHGCLPLQKAALRMEGEYLTRMEVLQAYSLFNKNKKYIESCSRFIAKFTQVETVYCELERFCGIGVNGEILNIQEVKAEHGYIPFDLLDTRILSNVKITELATVCTFCESHFVLKGIDPDFRWVAAECACDMQSHPFRWEGEKFLRLILDSFIAGKLKKFHGLNKRDSPPLHLMVKGLMPQYQSVHHFKTSAYAAYCLEARQEEEDLHRLQTNGTVVELTLIESLDFKNKPINVVRVVLEVGKSQLWCGEGYERMDAAILVPKENVEPNAFVSFPQTNCKENLKGQIYDIKESTKTALVVIRLCIPIDRLVDIGEEFIIVPKPPTSERKQIRKCINAWGPSTQGFTAREFDIDISDALKCKEQVIWNSIHYHYPWKCKAFTTNKSLLEILKDRLSNSYVGLELWLTLHMQNYPEWRRTTARVVAVDIVGLRLEFVLILPYGMIPYIGSGMAVAWVYGPHDDSTNVTPVYDGLGTDEMDEQDLLNDFDSIDSAEMFTSDSRFSLCLFFQSDAVIQSNLSSMSSIIRDWTKIPSENFTFLDHLLVTPRFPVTPDLPIGFVTCSRNDEISNQLRHDLNRTQMTAVDRMIRNRLSVIKGPPGTGKTTTICHGVASLFLAENGVIFLTCPSNYAATVAFESLLKVDKKYKVGMRVVRMLAKSKEWTVNGPQIGDCLHQRVLQHERYRSGHEIGKIIQLVETAGYIMLTLRQRKIYNEHILELSTSLLLDYNVVVCTVSCAVDGRLARLRKELERNKRTLSAVFVDEASLLTVPSTLALFALNPGRFCISGDDSQLGPKVKNYGAREACLDISLMEMLQMTPYFRNNFVFTMLDTQYRMAKNIGNVVSFFMYEGQIINHGNVLKRNYATKKNLLGNFPELQDSNIALYTYNQTAEEEVGISRINRVECHIIMELLKKLAYSSVPMKRICIISMYGAQYRMIKQEVGRLGEEFQDVQVATVDSFQGKENNVIILSTVRSNINHNIGFMRDQRRLTVALSRAIDYLFIVTDVRTFFGCKLPDLQRLERLLKSEGVKFINKCR